MPSITSDKDLPKSLNTPTKRVRRAKKLVAKYLGSAAKFVDNPPMQGMYSRGLFLTLADARKVVVQFRTEPLDVDAFKIAKGVLGPYVPDCEALPDQELESEGAWAYWLTLMPGEMWLRGVDGKGADGRIAINKSLGQIFSKGYMAETSGEAVEKNIRPHLDAILASSLEEVLPYKAVLEGFSDRLHELAQLPLWVAHHDINEVNVLIDDDCRVTALIDWELSTPLPFGVGFGRIHTIAGEYIGGEFCVPDEFEIAERGFWQELFGGMPDSVRTVLEKNMNLAQDAVILGTLLSVFNFEDGEVGVHDVGLKALPKLLSYRIPNVRGNEPPYGK